MPKRKGKYEIGLCWVRVFGKVKFAKTQRVEKV